MLNAKSNPATLQFQVLPNVPMIKRGDDLGAILCAVLRNDSCSIEDGDIVVIAQKIVSKAEGRLIPLSQVEPGDAALQLGKETDKDPRLCQLILDESDVVMRQKPGVIIVRHHLGHVGANAGIDQSNIEHVDGDAALLLPEDPDASAQRLHQSLSAAFACHVGVIIADSMNRPWRMGTIGGAIGCAGVQVLDDLRGGEDMFGRELKVAMVNRADSITAAACLIMGETTEGTPAVLVKGFARDNNLQRAADIMRPLEDDLFC